jgi:hypothetical protein
MPERYYIEHSGEWWCLSPSGWRQLLDRALQHEDGYDLELISGAQRLSGQPESVRLIRIGDQHGQPTYAYVTTDGTSQFRQPFAWSWGDFADELAILRLSAISADSNAGDATHGTEAAV